MNFPITAKLLPLLAIFFLAVFAGNLEAAPGRKISEEAIALREKLTGKLSPAARTWVILEGNSIGKDKDATENTVRADVLSRFAGQSMTPLDVDMITLVVMVEAARQMPPEKRTAFIESIPEIVKKISGAESAVLQNLK